MTEMSKDEIRNFFCIYMMGKISDDIKSAEIRHFCRSVEFRKYFYTHDGAMIQCFVNQ